MAVGIVPLASGAVGVALSPDGEHLYVTTYGKYGPHRPAVAGAVRAGLFPRDLALDPATGQVMLGNYYSATVEEFPVPAAP